MESFKDPVMDSLPFAVLNLQARNMLALRMKIAHFLWKIESLKILQHLFRLPHPLSGNQKWMIILLSHVKLWYPKIFFIKLKYFSPSIIFPSNTGPVSSTEHQTKPSSQIHSNSISSPAHSGRAFPQNRWINHNWVQTENSLLDVQKPVCSLKAQPGLYNPYLVSCVP